MLFLLLLESEIYYEAESTLDIFVALFLLLVDVLVHCTNLPTQISFLFILEVCDW